MKLRKNTHVRLNPHELLKRINVQRQMCIRDSLKRIHVLNVLILHYLKSDVPIAITLCSQFSSRIRIELIPSSVEESIS